MAALLTLIRATSNDRATSRAAFTDAFSDDLFELVKANNKDSLTSALQAVGKGPKWADLTAAITAGMAACSSAFPVNDNGERSGWIAAQHGGKGYAKAPTTERAPYALAHVDGLAAFKASLSASDLWRDITEDDKAKQKAEKAAKKAEAEAAAAEEKAKAVQAEINARMANGELVARDSVRLLADYSVCALVDEIESRQNITTDDLDALAALVAKLQKHHAQPLAA